MVEGKFGASWAPQIKRITLVGELVLVLAPVLLSQMTLGKSLSLWALVSPSETDQKEQIMLKEALCSPET